MDLWQPWRLQSHYQAPADVRWLFEQILLLMYFLYLYFQLRSHSHLFDADEDEDAEEEIAKMNVWSAVGSLIGVTVVTAFCADYLVDSIDEFSTHLGVPKVFIGIILLPIGE